jgi:hypothetical protein
MTTLPQFYKARLRCVRRSYIQLSEVIGCRGLNAQQADNSKVENHRNKETTKIHNVLVQFTSYLHRCPVGQLHTVLRPIELPITNKRPVGQLLCSRTSWATQCNAMPMDRLFQFYYE